MNIVPMTEIYDKNVASITETNGAHKPWMPEAFDILVAGAGLAGIRAAVTCARQKKRVLLITPQCLCSGSSFYPLMDTIHCLCTAGDGDKELFLQDIQKCSYGMNDEWMSRYYIDHIEESIMEIPETGIMPMKLPQKKLACFGHTMRDLYYWNGWDTIRAGVRKAVEDTGLITVMERTHLIHLSVQDGSINGALVQGPRGVLTVPVKAVILASGGIGGLYFHNLNTVHTTGSAHVLALKAGARLINMEFNQFIPGFLSPMYKTVFREGSLKYCTALTGPDGQDVLHRLLPDPADYEECLRLREPHGPFTTADSSRYFDIAMMKSALDQIANHPNGFDASAGCRIHYSPDILKDKRVYMRDYTAWLLKEHHVQIEQDPITIAPFFHAANGGIWVDHTCCTGVNGLYACGEAAGGIHGADRLGGMASGSCLVFGTLAADSACAYVEKAKITLASERLMLRQFGESLQPCGPFFKEPSVPANTYSAFLSTVNTPEDLCTRIKELMWQYGNIIRTERGLCSAISQIDVMGLLLSTRFIRKACPDAEKGAGILKASQYIDLSRAMLITMLNRRESRGGHYREDYPQTNPGEFSHRIAISIADGNYRVTASDFKKVLHN